MVVLALADRAHRAAAAGQPAADHAVHGDHRPDLHPRGPGAAALGLAAARRWSSASPTMPIDGCSEKCNITSASSTCSPPAIAGVLVAAAGGVLPEDAHRPRAARGGRRPPGRARGRHPAAAHLGDRLGGGGLRRAGGRAPVGRAQRRAVRADVRRAEGAAGADPRRLRLDRRRHRRRPDHRRHRRSWPRSTSGRMVGGGIESWFPYVLALLFLLVRPEGLFGEKHIERV